MTSLKKKRSAGSLGRSSKESLAGVQLRLPGMNRGGARRNAGRKAAVRSDGRRVHGSHARRVQVTRSAPLHVTVRVVDAGLPSLRSRELWPAVHEALEGRVRRGDFRLTHFCVASNHVHAIVEADDNAALAAGMKSLSGRVARAVNRALGRKGRVIEPRFHLHPLKRKAEYRNAVEYVLRNGDRHGGWDVWRPMVAPPLGPVLPTPDPMSSAAWFPHWAERTQVLHPLQAAATTVDAPRSWMAAHAFEGVRLSFGRGAGAGLGASPRATSGGGERCVPNPVRPVSASSAAHASARPAKRASGP